MIISASRRTDVPSFFFDWFLNRLQDGFVYVRNPMNYHQISEISLSTDVVDGIVFWTKNPLPMLQKLSALHPYLYVVQYTITPYGSDIEPHLPPKDMLLDACKHLSAQIGAERVIWRYDPIICSAAYPIAFHLEAFARFAKQLQGYVKTVIISFLDTAYKTVKRNIGKLALRTYSEAEKLQLAKQLACIARQYNLTICACAEEGNLQQAGIYPASCIDGRLFSALLRCPLRVEEDKTQRKACGCVKSIDIGLYNTCSNGCLYCYANYNESQIAENLRCYDGASPLLCGTVGENDRVHVREVFSLQDRQIKLD